MLIIPNITTRVTRTSNTIIIVSIANEKRVYIDGNCDEGTEWN